jgi:hypothetical protein
MSTINGAAELMGRSFRGPAKPWSGAHAGRPHTQVTAGKRKRDVEAKEIIDAFTDLERRLA